MVRLIARSGANEMIGSDIRRAIHERDRHRCMNCHRSGDGVILDVHHIVPRGQAGSNRFSNLILLCRQCHDAAHGKGMAPRIRFYTNGEMAPDEFEVFRQLFSTCEITLFDEEEQCWYIPLRDAREFLKHKRGKNPLPLSRGKEVQ